MIENVLAILTTILLLIGLAISVIGLVICTINIKILNLELYFLRFKFENYPQLDFVTNLKSLFIDFI